jgi:hypothetical protein
MTLRLGRLVRQNLRRNLGHNLLSAVGVVVGIAALSFFLALDAGVRHIVLGEIFPVDRLEVIPPTTTLFGAGGRITDAVLERLRHPAEALGVRPRAVFAKMKLAFPARGWGGGRLLGRGRDLSFEVSGFCDGMDPAIVKGEVEAPFVFDDWLASNTPAACGPTGQCPEGLYCVKDLDQCHAPVPVLVSRHLLELYNGSIAPSHPGLPRIPDFLTSAFRGAGFTVELGRSYIGTVAARGGAPIQRRFRLVGVSDKALQLGITVPLGYVRRWNQRYAGDAVAEAYSSAVILIRSKSDVTPLSSYVKSLGFQIKESGAEKAGLFITLATVLFTLISSIIVGIAAINISHTFMMLIADRRREIGVLRAIGASRGHIRAVILGEAAVVGLASGVLGLILALLMAWLCDWYCAAHLPDFPFKPATFFHFSAFNCAGVVLFALLFCLAGALLPAQRAAKLDPAKALASQ